jgi:hypothetical protein
MVNMINAPGRGEGESDDGYRLAHSFMDHYSISLRLGEPLSSEQLSELRDQNAAVREKLARLEQKLQHTSHKFDQYLPSTPQEKAWVAEYARAKAAYRQVPTHAFRAFPVYVVSEPSDLYAFYSHKEEQECRGVYAAVLSPLQPCESESSSASRASTTELPDVRFEVSKVLPAGWKISHVYSPAVPYGLMKKQGEGEGISITFSGPLTTKGPKGEPAVESFTIYIMPKGFVGQQEPPPGPSFPSARLLGVTSEGSPVYIQGESRIDSWPGWENAMRAYLTRNR